MSKKIYHNQIRRIIFNRLKGYQVKLFLFGSEASEIREELEESNNPYPVDLVDLSRAGPEKNVQQYRFGRSFGS